VNDLLVKIERLKGRLPQPYRPLVEPTKKRGLASVELPRAEKPRRAAAEVEASKRPQPPRERHS
jgi:hypothetical protein